ncbi:hypothetical protein N431DRAFT_487090 [Stipitochalara longipes BDJ]|nr:hypothetical protein N431DRAFT_487090 [Stipitochalara longipes BDJ]
MISNSIPTAYLAIYSILTLPIIYITFRHGKHGLVGWLYLFAFCTLRIVGGAMQISANNEGNVDKFATAALISNIGLSPLLLATSGILHEVRVYLIPNSDEKVEWILVLFIHFFVAMGVALVGVGSSAFKTTTPVKSSDHILAEIGLIILLLSWGAISVWALFTYPARNNLAPTTSRNIGTKLLYGLLATLPFTLIRLIYSIVYVFTRSSKLNPVTGSLGIRVGLSLIPELLTALIFVFAGLVTTPGRAVKDVGEHRQHGKDSSGNSQGVELT